MKHLSVVFVLLAAPAVKAQESLPPLGARHRVVVSAERLVGFAGAWREEIAVIQRGAQTSFSNSIQDSGTVAGLLGGTGGAPGLYMVPRLAVDVFLLRGLTVGVAASYGRSSYDRTFSASSTSLMTYGGAASTFLAAGRIGYLLPLGPTFSVWPRVAFTYVHAEQDVVYPGELSPAHRTMGLYALTVEALVTIRLVEHVHVLAGPTLDLGLDGAIETEGTGSGRGSPILPTREITETNLGFACGLAAAF